MTRIMGDATHANAGQLAAIRDRLQLVMGYDTGDPSIDWTPADVALFAGLPVHMIDQGFTGSPNLAATVRDVEYGAWQPGQAVDLTGWNVARPTLYITTGETGYNLGDALADGWRRDIWVPIPGWQEGQPLPALVQQAISLGCTLAAVQNDFSNPDFDLSLVLDPAWPASWKGDAMIIYAPDGIYLLHGGRLHHIQDTQSAAVYQSMGIPQSTSQITAAEFASLLADFPPGNPAVTVNAPAPKYAINGDLTPA